VKSMNRLKSERGSSTVLISLFLLSLVIFAVVSIVTSAQELKLARRNAETNKVYYTLDAEGKRFLYKVKSAVKESLNSMDNDPESFFSILESNLGSDVIIRKDPDGLKVIIERTIILTVDSYNRHLEVKIEVSQPNDESRINDICSVIEWRLWNEPFEYKNTIDLWEGNP
jgi:hypothetical protein